ncbi:multidrug resistance efflux transporter family protein [Bacillus sp. FJAT-22090]|uniref:DMT family transporter n=1 Tax=Bacillus sp. FJAT-22090 TaxID=1581038 RepID=UPI0011A6737D|nr:multidrug resistance efflux transporter family protein [Bacillus sp. FJAT-22090]
MREILLGVLASLFFAVTFILNRSMEVSGGSWLWSSSLRFFFMLPFLVIIVSYRKGLTNTFRELKSAPMPWFVWSFVGFVLFYGPLTFAAAYGPGWLISGMWQFTIVAGVLLAPLFSVKMKGRLIKQKIPIVSLFISLVILIGIILIQIPNTKTLNLSTVFLGILPVIVAAFAYPLGNRKMMDHLDGKLDTFQRVLGMTIASLPTWIILAVVAIFTVGHPSMSQVIQSLIVAVSSGVIATTLFFMATDRVRNHQGKLAAVEATQSTEILFVILGEMLILHIPLPEPIALIGLSIIILGMFLHSYYTKIVNTKLAFKKT